MITVSGIFASGADAAEAAQRLIASGIPERSIALLGPGTTDAEATAAVAHTEAGEGSAGKKLGGAVGRGLGIAGAIMLGGAAGSSFVPGVGAVLGVGILAAAILGASGVGLGKAAGSEIDEAIVSYLRRDEIFIYEEALRHGNTVLIAAVGAEPEAEFSRKLLLNSGAISIDEAHETWWSHMRRAEQAEYALRGHDFAADEPLYRLGFEAAQHPSFREKSYVQASAELSEQFGEDYRQPAFERGYERGHAHRQILVRDHSGNEKTE